MFDFYYQHSGGRRRLFKVKGSVCSIGSARSNDLIVDTRLVGKRHAELRLEPDGVYLRDLGSMSGSWVNRERVVEHGPISDLDEISVGDISLTVNTSKIQLSANDSTMQSEDANPVVKPVQKVEVAETTSDLELPTTKTDEALSYWGRIVHEQLLNQMDLRRKDVNRMTDQQLKDESLALIRNIISGLRDQIPDNVDKSALESDVLNEAVGLGPLEQFLNDEDVTEIMVNNHREIFIEKDGKLERSRYSFSSDATVYAVIERIITPIGRRIDESSPIVDARLKDGSRVNAVIPPLALKGPSILN